MLGKICTRVMINGSGFFGIFFFLIFFYCRPDGYCRGRVIDANERCCPRFGHNKRAHCSRWPHVRGRGYTVSAVGATRWKIHELRSAVGRRRKDVVRKGGGEDSEVASKKKKNSKRHLSLILIIIYQPFLEVSIKKWLNQVQSKNHVLRLQQMPSDLKIPTITEL